MNNNDSFMTRVVVGVMAAALVPATALAQAPAPPAPPPAPAAPPEAAPPAAPPPVEAAPPAPPPEPAPLPPPMEPAPPPPAAANAPEAPPLPPPAEEEKAEDAFKITTGAGFRGAVRFQDLEDPEAFGDVGLDELNLELRFSGKVTDVVGWTGNITVDGRTPTSVVRDVDGEVFVSNGPIKFQAQALDFIGQLDFTDEFHVWLGRMLTPSDRSNFSGAWFMSPWNYSGVFPDAYIGPRGTEEVGREVGATVWGNDKSGKFKYYAGVMDLDNPELSPLFTGRLAYAFIGDEPGFYSSSTYYGAKDMLVLGGAAQYQNESVVGTDEELWEVNADLLAEFSVPGTGTFTGEVAYYHMDGPVFAADDFYYALVSYLTPEPVGIGKIQLLARLQQSFGDESQERTAIEGVASYVIKDYFAKLAVSFTHFELPEDQAANWLQVGFQIQQ